VVIVPLLGITYLITLVGPREPDSLASLLFIHTRSVLISFQVAKKLEPCTVKAGMLCDFVLLTPSLWRYATFTGRPSHGTLIFVYDWNKKNYIIF
jgi:hypothetical protein